MSSQSRIQRPQLLPVVLLLCLQCSAALRCRTDDGPSEAELKRITRSCMRKIGENNSGSGAPSASSASTSSSSSSASSLFGSGTCNNNNNKNNNHSPQQQQQPQMRFGHNYDNDSDEDNNNSNNNNNHNYNTNYNFGGYGRGEPDMVRRRNRDRQQTTNPSGLTAQMAEKAHNAAPNNERTRYEYRSNVGGGGGGAGNGGSNSAGGRSGNGNGGNGNNGGNGGGGHGSNRNGANSNNSGNNNAGKNSNNNNNNNNNSTYDSACVVHCFFEEMNMLNADDYPDRYKVQYLLTRELRDRELRHFYTDTIQQCFHYLESQRRRDKCHYSRELINCMSEYAKANCDDWQEYNVIFN